MACQKVLAEEPDNLRAHALRMVALYRLGRYPAMAEAARESKMMGVFPRAMMKIPRFAQMVQEEQREHRIPADRAKHFLPSEEGDGPSRRFRNRLPEGN